MVYTMGCRTGTLGNNMFNYQWLNGTQKTIIIADGYYDLDDLNQQFKLIIINSRLRWRRDVVDREG